MIRGLDKPHFEPAAHRREGISGPCPSLYGGPVSSLGSWGGVFAGLLRTTKVGAASCPGKHSLASLGLAPLLSMVRPAKFS